MTPLRRLQASRWTGSVLAVPLLSQVLGGSRAFLGDPSPGASARLLPPLGLLLALMAFLAVAVYAEARSRGQVHRPRPLLDRAAKRLFPDLPVNP